VKKNKLKTISLTTGKYHQWRNSLKVLIWNITLTTNRSENLNGHLGFMYSFHHLLNHCWAELTHTAEGKQLSSPMVEKILLVLKHYSISQEYFLWRPYRRDGRKNRQWNYWLHYFDQHNGQSLFLQKSILEKLTRTIINERWTPTRHENNYAKHIR
jgi:hypothetical protein